jgi:hypothetical protein
MMERMISLKPLPFSCRSILIILLIVAAIPLGIVSCADATEHHERPSTDATGQTTGETQEITDGTEQTTGETQETAGETEETANSPETEESEVLYGMTQSQVDAASQTF